MSKVDVIMPQMGESIAEGTLTRWMKSVGETVDRDEDLFEISTDKVDADIPSPVGGVLAEILVQEGDTVEVNTIVARIETDASVAVSAESPPPAVATESRSTEAASTSGPETREDRIRTRSTPLVRKIAAEHNVDITALTGTGAGGRVTRDDILAFIESGAAATTTPAPVATPTVTPPAVTPAQVDPSPTPPAAVPASPRPPTPTASAPGSAGVLQVQIHGAMLEIKLGKVPIRENDRVEEMSRVRLRTMEHMLMSKRVSAHVTSVNEIDFEHVVKLRRKMKGKYLEQGAKLTYGPFVYRAVIEALREYPILNASVDGARIVYHANINLGIAVSVNDGTELIVPVLKDADRLSLLGLARGANDLAEKARSKDLDFDDIQGGTFTITNVGVFGNLFGTPIINQPQVAILGTGLIEKRPVVVQDALGNDVIAIRHRAYFGLSYDHRVVDGAMAAFFLKKVQDYLENFPDD